MGCAPLKAFNGQSWSDSDEASERLDRGQRGDSDRSDGGRPPQARLRQGLQGPSGGGLGRAAGELPSDGRLCS